MLITVIFSEILPHPTPNYTCPALRAYVKQAGESLEMQNSCAEIKIRAERRIGEFSKELPINKAKSKATSHDGESFKSDILKDAGIKHHERYEAIADIPEEKFEEHIEHQKYLILP